MTVIKYEKDTEKNFENIIVFKRLLNGVLSGWTVKPATGYQLQRSSQYDTGTDADTANETPVKKCFSQVTMPKNYNWDNFDWIAVPVDQK